MNTIATPAGSSHLHRADDEGAAGSGVGVGVGGMDFLGGPRRAEVARCQVLTNAGPLLASSDWRSAGHTVIGDAGRYRDAHAASLQSTFGSRPAVAGGDGIMLVSGVPARARRTRRRLATRCCRHKVAFPQKEFSGKIVEDPGRRPRRQHIRCAAGRNERCCACSSKSTAPRPHAKSPISHEPITATDRRINHAAPTSGNRGPGPPNLPVADSGARPDRPSVFRCLRTDPMLGC